MSYIPIESKTFKGWFLIPNFNGYLANRNGEILIIDKNHITKGNTTKGDYYRLKVKLNGENKFTLVHRLVCAAFYGAPKPNKYFVNHKNGVKQDNFYLNLEWVSPHENNTHAVLLGLNNGRDGRPLKVYDVIDKVQICFRTKNDLTKYIPNSSLSGIFNAIESKNFYFNRYFIVDLDEDIDFGLITYLTDTWFRVRYITDGSDTPDEVYESVTKIAKILGQDNYMFLSKINSGELLFGYRLIKKFNDKEPWPTEEQINSMNVTDSPDVIVFSKSQKKYFIFRNVNSAAQYFNVPVNNVFRRCRTRNINLTDDLLVKFLADKSPFTFTVI